MLSTKDELYEVQLQALEWRIRALPCLVLFLGKKEAMYVMEHYSRWVIVVVMVMQVLQLNQYYGNSNNTLWR